MAFTSDNQSVAAFVAADKVAFYHCAFFFSLHNTLFDTSKVPSTSSSVVKLPFYNCEIFVVSDKRVKPYGSITAHHIKKADENTGYVFIRGKVYGIDDVYLGRAKGPYSRMEKRTAPNRSYDGSTKDLYHAEYKCPGPGADRQRRSDWAKELTKQEVEFFLSIDFIDGTYWLPVLLQQTS
ncbi:hypothetical protein Bca4012_090515 [Brassica carinata]|uniref:Uncharacterized protein n=1 Tax=Brassica oleracea TaxID=3712 RepID=A0A3P6FWW3_BRAOL|nr:unnamed protein product [Brassica oleracea]